MYIDPRFEFDAAASPADIALFNGAAYGLVEQVTEALAQGANVNVRDTRNSTPLHVAAAYSAASTLRVLAKTDGVDFCAVDELGRTPSSLAYEVAENFAVGRYLLKKEVQQHRARGTWPSPPEHRDPSPR